MTTSDLTNINLLSKTQFNSLTTLADDELYAISASGVSLPSDRYLDLTLPASGQSYTAPANGYLTLCKTATGNQYITLRNNSNGLYGWSYGISGYWVACTIPCRANDTIYIEYNTGGATNIFRFIYAEGEV